MTGWWQSVSVLRYGPTMNVRRGAVAGTVDVATVQYVTMPELPGGIPAALVDRGGRVVVYIAAGHPEALTATRHVLWKWAA